MNPLNQGSFTVRNKYLSNITDIIYTWYICGHAQVHRQNEI